MALSKPQRRALRWIADQGGYALLDSYGRAVARGQKAPFATATWTRLLISGHLAPAYRLTPTPSLADHFGISDKGLEALRDGA